MFSSELQDFIKHRYTSQVCENEESEGSFGNKDFDCYSSDIFSQGLHTTVIYALERIRIIAENSSLLDPNPISIQTGHKVITDQSYHEIEEACLNSVVGFEQILIKIIEEKTKFLSSSKSWNLFICIALILQYNAVGMSLLFFNYQRLKKALVRKKHLLGMLSFPLILSNGKLKQLLLNQ